MVGFKAASRAESRLLWASTAPIEGEMPCPSLSLTAHDAVTPLPSLLRVVCHWPKTLNRLRHPRASVRMRHNTGPHRLRQVLDQLLSKAEVCHWSLVSLSCQLLIDDVGVDYSSL